MQMAAEKGNKSIFFAAQRELIQQLGSQLSRLNIPSKVVMSGVENEYQSYEEDILGEACTLIAKDTLWARAFRKEKMDLPQADVVQIDEAHGSLAKTYQAILKRYEKSIVLGWTATPCRTDGLPLGMFYDTMVLGPTYKELQDEGFLVPVSVYAPDRPDLKGLKARSGDYAKEELEKRMNRDNLVGNIIQEWWKHNDGRSTVVFASGVQHSIHIRNQFLSKGVTAAHIDGSMPEQERADILSAAREGDIRVVTNYGVLHTGVDIPRWKYLVCARPTKSFQLWRQMGGRIQRPWNSVEAMIQDHSDNAQRFGYPDEDVEWDLDGTQKIQDKHNEARKKKQQSEKSDFQCQNCSTKYRGPSCPKCGHKPVRVGKDVEMGKGDLKALERSKANRAATPMDKQKTWDECLGLAIAKGMKVGAAAHMYKDRYGVFPNHAVQNVPRTSQWQMNAKDFYHQVIKPAKEAAKL